MGTMKYESPANNPVDPMDSGSGTPPADPVAPMSEDEKDFVRLAESKFKAYKRYRSHFDPSWERWMEMYFSNPEAHMGGMRPQWRSTPVLNFFFATIETIVPVMTDGKPTLTAVAQDSMSQHTAVIMSRILDNVWTDNDMHQKLPMAVRMMLQIGTSMFKVWYDDSKDQVAISVVNPKFFYPSPGATDIEDADGVFYAAVVPIGKLERDFPDNPRVQDVRPGLPDNDTKPYFPYAGKGSSDGSFGTNLADTTYPAAGAEVTRIRAGGKEPDSNRQDQGCLLLEYWFRSKDHPEGEVAFIANGILLDRKPNPYKHKKFPFVVMRDYAIEGQFWGMGEAQSVERLQEDINKRRAQVIDIMRLCGNPPLMADDTSGINPKALVSRPGVIVYKRQGTEANWLQPPQLPAAMFTIQEMDKADFDAVTGIYDVTQGRKPAGIEAASAIVELQEAAQTRLRLKVRNMEDALRKINNLAVPTIQQFWPDERIVRVMNRTNIPEFYVINGKYIDTKQEVRTINDISAGNYDVLVGAGSTLPVSRTRKFSQMVQLFELGVVDRRAVLEESGIDNYEEIIARLEAAEAQAMQQQSMLPQEGEPSAHSPDPMKELGKIEQGLGESGTAAPTEEY